MKMVSVFQFSISIFSDESEQDSLTDGEQEKNAALLYGMVHARYILTNK